MDEFIVHRHIISGMDRHDIVHLNTIHQQLAIRLILTLYYPAFMFDCCYFPTTGSQELCQRCFGGEEEERIHWHTNY